MTSVVSAMISSCRGMGADSDPAAYSANPAAMPPITAAACDVALASTAIRAT